MKPKRLISLLVAVCMMITMLPLSAVTAFAADTSTVRTAIVDGYKYEYTINTEDDTATIKYFRGPVDSEGNVDSANNGPYDIDIPSELDHHPVTGLGAYSFSGYASASPYPHNSYQIGRNIRSVDIPQGVTSIGNHAFFDCFDLENITIPQSVTSIGDVAFGCCKFTTLSLGENIETIGGGAFWHCSNLSEITIPENVKEIKNGYSENIYYRKTFEGCSHLKCIILPAGFKSFEASLRDCPTDCVIYYNNDWDHAKDLLADNDNSWYLYNDNGKLKNRNFLYLCKVTFDANSGELNDYDGNLTDHAVVPVYRTEKITETIANDLNATDLDAINAPKRAGYKFIGWYTTEDGKPEDGKFDVKETAITDDITLYAGWEFDPNALSCHQLTVTGGTVTVKYDGSDVTNTLTVTPDVTGNKKTKTYSVPDGAEVTVTLDKTLIPEGMVFDIWSTGKFSLPLGQDYKAESITFPMSSDVVDIAAQYRDATIEDDGPNVLGTAAIIGTAAVGTAVLGYQAYSLGAEFVGKLMALPYFPSNRSALAMMLWEDAGKPMPESEILYPDVGQEEQDMDLQHAARWAMEHDLMPDLNDQDTELPPEQVKYYPDNMVTKISVLRAWKKAQDLKQNAQ
mgnify:CR=1 FL=1